MIVHGSASRADGAPRAPAWLLDICSHRIVDVAPGVVYDVGVKSTATIEWERRARLANQRTSTWSDLA